MQRCFYASWCDGEINSSLIGAESCSCDERRSARNAAVLCIHDVLFAAITTQNLEARSAIIVVIN